jgi:hypothetical protein
MEKKKIKKIISTFLTLVVFIVVSFYVPQKVKAQGLSGYIEGIIPAITQLPLCKRKLTSGITNLFGGGDALNKIQKKGENKLESKVEGKIESVNSVPVHDEATYGKVVENLKTSKDTKKSVEAIDQNDTCLKSIGRLIIKQLLQKFTLSTVEWINGGMDSEGPKFVQNPGAFFKDIAKNEILQFGIEINNPQLFPFGQAFMQNQARAFQTHFAQNARYSLNEMIQSTNNNCQDKNGRQIRCDVAFSEDFSQGGWNAWTYLTQVPANNPLGFNLMASNELQKRLEGTNQSNAQDMRDALQQAGGYLGDYRCADPKGVTKEEHERALAESAADFIGPPSLSRICKRWEYVTPGGMVADAATKLVNYPDNNLLKAEDLNDAIAAILDALLNSFSSKLMGEGFADFSEAGSEGEFFFNYDAGFNIDDYTSQTEIDYPNFILENSTFLQNYPNFDIRKDLTQAVVDEQRIFLDKLVEQNTEIESTTDGIGYAINPTTGETNAYGLLPTIRQLDYCIPGPHPDWEQEARENYEKLKEDKFPDTTGMNFLEIKNAYGENSGSNIDDVLKLLGDYISQMFGIDLGSVEQVDSYPLTYGTGAPCNQQITATQCVNRIFYKKKLNKIAGLSPKIHQENNVEGYDKAVNILDNVFNQFVKAMNNVYIPEVLPIVAKEAKGKFQKIEGYLKIKKDNEEKITTMSGVVSKLTAIKRQIDQLNERLGLTTDDPDYISQEDYQKAVKEVSLTFGRLSADMITGDDIALVDTFTKQIVVEKNYTLNTLIQGDQGCEKDLEEMKEEGTFPVQLSRINRTEYPSPILYKYPNTPENLNGFLYYGMYTDFSLGSAENEAFNLCMFYAGHGNWTQGGCTPGGTGAFGPNYIWISNLMNWDDYNTTRLLKDTFEKNLKIY